MDKIVILKICGVYNLLFALFHIAFWKIFKWKQELPKYNRGDKAIIQILNLRLIYVFLLFAFLFVFFSNELLNTNLGMAILIGVLLFWLGRTIEQFIFLRIKSKMVTVLTIVFFVGVILHALPLIF